MIIHSKNLNLDKYDTDKISNRYMERYDPVLEPWVDKKITLFELGIRNGGSLLLWRDYFRLGTIVGLDIKLPHGFEPGDRIHMFEGSQDNTQLLTEIADKTAPEGFDIIIDDASHIGELTKTSFWHLFDNHLKPGGLYVIEDWGTGYWGDWPDGHGFSSSSPDRDTSQSDNKQPDKNRLKTPFPCHSYGMVGFVKELVDEQGAGAITRGSLAGKPTRSTKFQNMLIDPSIVFVWKTLR